MVDIEPVMQLPDSVSLQSVRDNPACENMLLIRRGQRLSIQPVDEDDFDTILTMGGASRDSI
jgi:predicted RNA-binding protein with PUA-like domain